MTNFIILYYYHWFLNYNKCYHYYYNYIFVMQMLYHKLTCSVHCVCLVTPFTAADFIFGP
jgi:hypothetical protein